jgi:hypothetical protein
MDTRIRKECIMAKKLTSSITMVLDNKQMAIAKNYFMQAARHNLNVKVRTG